MGQLRRDADLRVPRVYYYVIRYVVPLMLIVLLAGWCIQNLGSAILLKGVPPENMPTSGVREPPYCW